MFSIDVTLSGMLMEVRLWHPSNISAGILVISSGQSIDMEDNEVQKRNTPHPKLVTLFGIIMDWSFLQLKNASLPMACNPSGRMIVSNSSHNLNALLLIYVTPSGMVIEVRFEAWKAYSPMVVTLAGIIVFEQPWIRVLDTVSIMALQLSLLSKTLFSGSTIIVVKYEQLEKEVSPIRVTLLGMKMEDIPQPVKAPSSIVVTLSGMETDVIRPSSSSYSVGIKALVAIPTVPSFISIWVFAGIAPLYPTNQLSR